MSRFSPSECSSADEVLATITHARLRVAQGDLRRAGQLLREILARDPDDERARDLLKRLGRCAGSDARARRLERWLERITRPGRD